MLGCPCATRGTTINGSHLALDLIGQVANSFRWRIAKTANTLLQTRPQKRQPRLAVTGKFDRFNG